MSPDSSNYDSKLAEQLRRLVQAAEAAGRAVLPHTNQELLQSIVEAAARIFGAAAASIALVDEKQQVLVFKVAYGAGNESVIGMQIPLDQGIAGYVAMTGQPIAISNVRQDARFNQDFAQSTGYVPRSILATPLVSDGSVIGVMEVLDKINAPSFGMQDMELLGIFAWQAAIAIHQSQQLDHLGEALVHGLKKLARGNGQIDSAEINAALESALQDASGAIDLRILSDLIYDISALGEAEQKACMKILEVFREYGSSQPRLF